MTFVYAILTLLFTLICTFCTIIPIRSIKLNVLIRYKDSEFRSEAGDGLSSRDTAR